MPDRWISSSARFFQNRTPHARLRGNRMSSAPGLMSDRRRACGHIERAARLEAVKSPSSPPHHPLAFQRPERSFTDSRWHRTPASNSQPSIAIRQQTRTYKADFTMLRCCVALRCGATKANHRRSSASFGSLFSSFLCSLRSQQEML